MISYLGIDIGGTKVALRVESADLSRSDEASFRWSPGDSATQDLDVLAENVATIAGTCPEPVTAIGIALPATLDNAGRVTTWPNRPTWAGIDLGARLRDLVPGATVHCADDGDLAAIAEAREADRADVVYLGVGTGIGGGIVLGGRPCPGHGSCEIGHMVIDRFGALCDCGRRGCVQAVASGPATLRRARELRGGDVEFAELLTAVGDGRTWAVTAVDETCAALAVAVVSLTELVHPALVVIGGGFAAALPDFVPAVFRHTVELSRRGTAAVPIQRARLGGLSSLTGAILLARGDGLV